MTIYFSLRTALIVVACANLLAFALCALDKSAARRGAPRIPEAMFFTLALAGGWPLLLVAMRMFRHKTAKTSFKMRVYLAVICDLILAAYVIFL